MNSMKNLILVAGSINMDIVLQVDHLPQRGETIFAKTLRYIPGGKGANQAVAASRLGGKVAFIGKIGQDDFGTQLQEYLKKEKLDLTGLESSTISSGVALITIDKNGDNLLVSLQGANSEVRRADIDKQKDLIKKAKVVVSVYEIILPTIEHLFGLAKKNGCTTLLNAAPPTKTPERLWRKVDYLVINETELAFYVGSKKVIEKEKEIVAAAKKLQTKGVGTIVATLGAKGAITVTKNGVIRTAGLKVKAVDTTAAGDCFVGALAVQLSRDVGLEKALHFANRAAALAVQRYGASSSLPYLKELG